MRACSLFLAALSLSFTGVACVPVAATTTATPSTVTTSIYRVDPPTGWSTFVDGDTVFVVSAGDAEAIERDRGLATADTVWIRITATPIGVDEPLAEIAANLWRSEAWIEAGGNSVIALEDVPLPDVTAATVGDFSGVGSERTEPGVRWLRYLLDVAPGQALQVTLRLPTGHAGIDTAEAAIQSLKHVAPEPGPLP